MVQFQEAWPPGPRGWAQDSAAAASGRFAALTNLVGAALSLALIVGVGLWAYQIVMRDVSGVPVVRAAEGPMRSQPEEPGGLRVVHQGLSVNAVAARGAAAQPADRLILAPPPLDLAPEDAPRPELRPRYSAPATEVSATTAPGPRIDATPGGPEALQLAAVPAPGTQRAEDGPPPGSQADAIAAAVADAMGVPAPVTGAATAAREPRPGAGPARSLRPRPRPAQPLGAAAPDPAAPAAAVQEVAPDTIASGTRLAQLGAFESADAARREWDRLAARFGDYLIGKSRVIQETRSGGRTFYRLRALGFDDLADARQFCSVLLYQKAECIPVVAR